MEAGILSIDGQGGKQGTLSISFYPCTINGETDEELIPEDLMVEKPEELIGKKDIHFKVCVDAASGLPANLCCNPFVTYQFKFENSLFTTEEIQGNNTHAKWKYNRIHTIKEMTKDILEELKTGSISFMVYAYPPAREKIGDLGAGDKTMERRQTKILEEPPKFDEVDLSKKQSMASVASSQK